jgi:SAM-dependent methyltransferase
MATNDPTFRHYAPSQAASYARDRGSYNLDLLSEVFSYHASTGGSFNAIVDLGCGPGNSTRDLALQFQKATGIDPGKEMINQAKEKGGETAAGVPIEYFVGDAEEVGDEQGIGKASVDLITAAMAVSTTLCCMNVDEVNCRERRIGSEWMNSGKMLPNLSNRVGQWRCGLVLHCIAVSTSPLLLQRS